MSSAAPTRKALIVDDDPEIRQLLTVLIRRNGFSADYAGDGFEAVSRLKHKRYDLVLLDLMMPRASGLEVIRHYEQTSDPPVPIIVLSGASEGVLEELNPTIVQGALRKPVDLRELEQKIREVCGEGLHEAKAANGDPSP